MHAHTPKTEGIKIKPNKSLPSASLDLWLNEVTEFKPRLTADLTAGLR